LPKILLNKEEDSDLPDTPQLGKKNPRKLKYSKTQFSAGIDMDTPSKYKSVDFSKATQSKAPAPKVSML
jgi:hypothetical protein